MRRTSLRSFWPPHPALATGLVAGIALLTYLAPPEDRAAVALAAMNLALVATALGWLGRMDWVSASPILAFLPGLALCWPASTLYFVFADPGAQYPLDWGSVSCLEGASQLQATLLLFLVCYLLAACSGLELPKAARLPRAPPLARAEAGAIAIGLAAVTAGWVAGIPGLSPSLAFALSASRNFLVGYVLIAGIRWKSLGRLTRAFVLLTLAVAGAVHTVANARGYALVPILLWAAGYAAAHQGERRKVLALVAAGAIAFPAYLVVGNQTRLALGTIGMKNFDQRASVLLRAFDRGLLHDEKSGSSDIAGRLFSRGGHALITRNWNRGSGIRFDPGAFLSEAAATLLPAFVFGQPPEDYHGSALLRRYGFLITNEVSFEVSLVGSFFYYGGLAAVALGGLVVGLLHRLLVRLLSTRTAGRPWRLAATGGVVGLHLLAYNYDVIENCRALAWTIVLAYLLCGIAGRVLARRRSVGSGEVPCAS